jgi:hypothetical protein
MINLKIHNRILPTVDGGSPLYYFDGATMLSYLHPSKASEVVFCRRKPELKVCAAGHGFDPERKNLPLSVLEVKTSSLGEFAGRGVFTKVDVPHMSYLGLEKLIHVVYMHPATYDVIVRLENHWTGEKYFGEVADIYSHGYGHSFSHHVSRLIYSHSFRLKGPN